MNIFKHTGTPQTPDKDNHGSIFAESKNAPAEPEKTSSAATTAPITPKGTFIVIEGIDGSGKGTQFRLLSEKLEKLGYDIATFDFPRYDEPSSYFVREYLNGNYGNMQQVGPYAGSLFYALDRYAAAEAVRKALDAGKVVLANRYVGSNMAHQGTKLAHAEQRRGFFIWLDNLEFEMLRVPRPDINLVLRMPAETAQQLVDKKTDRSYTDKKRDLHEADLPHFKQAVEVYDDLCQLFPKDYQRLDCVRDGQLLDVADIQKLVWEKVSPWLSLPAAGSNGTGETNRRGHAVTATQATPANTSKEPYIVPETLDQTTKAEYITYMDNILVKYAQMEQTLLRYAQSQNITQVDAVAALRGALPIGVTAKDLVVPVAPRLPGSLAALAAKYAPPQYGSDETTAVALTDVWPRNELALVPDMLYPYSNLSYKSLRQASGAWSYEQKAEVWIAYLAEQTPSETLPGTLLAKAFYSWDVVSDVEAFLTLQAKVAPTELAWQPLTPRYGYKMPQLIDDAGLTDMFDDCFDTSLKLYSLLQEKYPVEAQYATLIGHKIRWQLTCNAGVMYQLINTAPLSGNVHELLMKMLDQLHETHPIISTSLVG